MKNERGRKIEFWVTETQHQKIISNMKRNGMDNLSEFLRILAFSEAEIRFSVTVPNIVRISEAELGSGVLEGKVSKRAAG